jgi:hypothetical protein
MITDDPRNYGDTLLISNVQQPGARPLSGRSQTISVDARDVELPSMSPRQLLHRPCHYRHDVNRPAVDSGPQGLTAARLRLSLSAPRVLFAPHIEGEQANRGGRMPREKDDERLQDYHRRSNNAESRKIVRLESESVGTTGNFGVLRSYSDLTATSGL